ncbi:MAG: IclR family transcriptional regulator [Acidobacteriota bacterium]|nr:IclR family transcriptional regulator [Acidobacteriota bacterium]
MKDSQKNPQKYYVPALEKGLDILEVLASSSAPQSLSELARRLSRTSSELFRMLNALEKRGYIEREPVSGKYGLTLRLYELAHTHSPVEKMLRAASIPMRTLAESIKESCHISTLDSERLVVLAQAESPEVFRFSVEVGSTFSPAHTASGRLLLAHLKEAELRHFCETSEDYCRLSSVAKAKLPGRLEEIRQKGVSMARNEPVIGVRAFAVLVGNPEIDIMAALAVASLDIRGRKDKSRKIIRGLQAAALEINGAIGLRL